MGKEMVEEDEIEEVEEVVVAEGEEEIGSLRVINKVVRR